MPFLGLWSKLKGYLVLAGIFLAALVTSYTFGRRDGKHLVHNKIKDDLIEDVETKNEIRNDVRGLSDDELSKRVSKWTRK